MQVLPIPDTTDFSNPESVLRTFLQVMNRWEVEAFARLGRDNRPRDPEEERVLSQEASDALDEIFATYCTPRKRKQGRQNCLAMRSPPEYDAAAEIIEEVMPKTSQRTEIFTRDTRPFGKPMAYVLLKKQGRWLLDSKKIKYHDGWENYYL